MSKEKTFKQAWETVLDEQLTALSVEMDGISAMNELLAVYMQDALSDIPQNDTLNPKILVDYTRGIASYASRIAEDLATFDLKQQLDDAEKVI